MKWEISKFIPYKHQLEMFIVNFGENLLAYLLVGNLGKLKEHLYFIFFLTKTKNKLFTLEVLNLFGITFIKHPAPMISLEEKQ